LQNGYRDNWGREPVPENKVLVVDACIPIAKFNGKEPAFQQQHTDRFCKLVEREPIKIVIIKKVLDEVSKKFPNLSKPTEEYLSELKLKGKFELVENKEFANKLGEIIELRRIAKLEDYDLSFEDSLQIYYAEKAGVPLISWDNAIIDFCETKGTTAFRPNEFCDDYERKYG